MKLAFRVLAAILTAFYIFVIFLVLNPNVSAEYRAYYITHETEVWARPAN